MYTLNVKIVGPDYVENNKREAQNYFHPDGKGNIGYRLPPLCKNASNLFFVNNIFFFLPLVPLCPFCPHDILLIPS